MEWIEVPNCYNKTVLAYKSGTKTIATIEISNVCVSKVLLPDAPSLKMVVDRREAIAMVESAVDQWLLDANLAVTYR